jgi:hypothetical protein
MKIINKQFVRVISIDLMKFILIPLSSKLASPRMLRNVWSTWWWTEIDRLLNVEKICVTKHTQFPTHCNLTFEDIFKVSDHSFIFGYIPLDLTRMWSDGQKKVMLPKRYDLLEFMALA